MSEDHLTGEGMDGLKLLSRRGEKRQREKTSILKEFRLG
jgi:hypothetical protein